jgi:hypothetical protein
MAAAKKTLLIHFTTWFAKFTECRMKPQQLLAGSKNMALMQCSHALCKAMHRSLILYLYIQMHHRKVLRVQLHLTANLVLLMSIIVIYKEGRGGWQQKTMKPQSALRIRWINNYRWVYSLQSHIQNLHRRGSIVLEEVHIFSMSSYLAPTHLSHPPPPAIPASFLPIS